MSENRLKRRKLHKKLFTKNRLVILKAATTGAILLITFTTFIIAFTPLREFIPGYSSSQLKKDATELALKSDSLTIALKQNEAYIKSIQKVLTVLQQLKLNLQSIYLLLKKNWNSEKK